MCSFQKFHTGKVVQKRLGSTTSYLNDDRLRLLLATINLINSCHLSVFRCYEMIKKKGEPTTKMAPSLR